MPGYMGVDYDPKTDTYALEEWDKTFIPYQDFLKLREKIKREAASCSALGEVK